MLYRLQIDSPVALIGNNNSSGKELNELWHKRMGHLHHGALRMLKETVTGVLELGSENDDVVEGVYLGSMLR